jgi:hypothetical protein
MIRKSTVSILLVSIVAFLGGLAGSLGARSDEPDKRPDCPPGPHGPMARHLKLPPEVQARIDALDPTFAEDLAALRDERRAQRRELASLLESTESTDDDIRACVEHGIETHNRFERRVLDHLLLVRRELTSDEQKRLFHSISKRMRGRGRGFGPPRGPGGDEADPRSWKGRHRGRGHRRGDDGDRPGRGRRRGGPEHVPSEGGPGEAPQNPPGADTASPPPAF